MGCAASVPANEEETDPFLRDKLLNDAVEQSMQLNRVNDKTQFKLLLLGAGESGKSTVLKQLRLLHKGGFNQEERAQYAQVIWADVIQSMKTLIVNARRLGIPLTCDQPNSSLSRYKQIVLQINALDQIDTGAAGGESFLNDYVMKYGENNRAKRRLNSTGIASQNIWDEIPAEENSMDPDPTVYEDLNKTSNDSQFTRLEVAEAIDQLWKYDSGIQMCYKRSNEFQLESSTTYYFENIFKFSNPLYLCSDMDILKGRIKTTGITETDFNIKKFKFKVLDAGGQRSERKKWIHCFENITAVLFVLAISEYDQTLFEDEKVNRIHEAIILFDSLCNSRWFKNTPFILFLNKIDIFEAKLYKSPLKNYFPDYNGKPTDVDEAIKFFEVNFLKLNRSNKPIYVHRTCATDTKSMKFVLSAVTDLVVQLSLKKSGII